ncbi:MAG: hypothetical protein AVO39_04220 [delta proteobacterium MLS_D]|jgi:uncharacterized protein|nr:MAG: hypothetical protein AVO39_04220 [delta proteobacterium MLS_D]
MHIIIDGYNLIRQSDVFRAAEKTSLETGRNRLIHSLALYNQSKSHRITVVFDGWIEGSPQEERYRERGIDVVYSRRGERADEVIKRMARRGGSDLLVVSSDRDIALSVTKAGGVALSSHQFETKMRDDHDGQQPSEQFPGDSDDDEQSERVASTKKKGPARKRSKRERKTLKALRKL